MQRKTELKIGIFGQGAFGSFIKEVFAKGLPNINLYSYDSQKHSKTSLNNVLGCDIIVLAVPFSAYPHLLKMLSSHIKKETVIMDICSVKLAPKEYLLQYLPGHEQFLITHPLFGPQSIKNHDIRDATLIVTDVIGQKSRDFLSMIEKNLQPHIVTISADEHDKVMAQVHALTFFVAKGLGGLNLQDIPFRTPSYKMITDMVKFDTVHTAELYDTIQKANPYAASIREKFIDSLRLAHLGNERHAYDNLDDLRVHLDFVDKQIFTLLRERFELTRQVGEYKARNRIPAVDKQREEAQFKKARELAEELGINPDVTQKILRTIIDQVVQDHNKLAQKITNTK